MAKHKPIKICILGDISSIHMLRWCEHFKQKGFFVHIIDFMGDAFIFNKNKKMVPERYTKLKIPLYNISQLQILKNVIRKSPFKAVVLAMDLMITYCTLLYIINKIKPDLIHAQGLTNYGYWASKTNYHPLVLSAWGGDIIIANSESYKKELKKMFNKADLVHTNDEPGKKRLLELGCEENKIFKMQWGVDTQRFSPNSRSDALRREILGEEEGTIVTIVRSLKSIYDVQTLIKAIPLVISKNISIKFFFIGDGHLRNDLEKMAEDLGITEYIIFKGNVPNEDLHIYLSSSDIFVDTPYPTQGGAGIGVGVLEAMSSGMPIIAANRPGLEYGVIDGYNGYIFPGGNPKILAEKIALLVNNKKNIEDFGINSRELACKIGNWDTNMNKIEEMYRKHVK